MSDSQKKEKREPRVGSVTIYATACGALKRFPPEVRVKVYDAIVDYELYGDEPDFGDDDQEALGLFEILQPGLDSIVAKKEGGSSGGRPKKAKAKEDDPSAKHSETYAKPKRNHGVTSGEPNGPQMISDKCEMVSGKCEEGETPPTPQGGSWRASAPGRNAKDPLTAVQRRRFERWYATYPRKISKQDAVRAWAKLDPDDTLTDRMIRAVQEQMQADDRFREQRFTPHPASWLNGGEWENEYSHQQPRGKPGDVISDWSDDLEAANAEAREAGWEESTWEN